MDRRQGATITGVETADAIGRQLADRFGVDYGYVRAMMGLADLAPFLRLDTNDALAAKYIDLGPEGITDEQFHMSCARLQEIVTDPESGASGLDAPQIAALAICSIAQGISGVDVEQAIINRFEWLHPAPRDMDVNGMIDAITSDGVPVQIMKNHGRKRHNQAKDGKLPEDVILCSYGFAEYDGKCRVGWEGSQDDVKGYKFALGEALK
jgi:hypothetical protein